MELRELRSLVVLSEVGSITKTAEKLNLSAAAIHKQLKMLESELGIQLYEKGGANCVSHKPPRLLFRTSKICSRITMQVSARSKSGRA